ncbi:hypothetical protein [Streptomyces sp. NBC_01314]|uniref:hypothetical protein n=1 Tax=Streptomyces sp. NBC_01314 TaxID=2903821 RepID=UPI00308AC09C|nr:hypothetical protein OG622_37785 [Streptomyces sp. NBC_01314]
MTRADDALTVCVIGAGPHGLSVLERIRADAGGAVRPVEVHTVASEVTLFTDDNHLERVFGHLSRAAPALGVPVEGRRLRKAMHGHGYENGSRGEAVVRGRENYGATL